MNWKFLFLSLKGRISRLPWWGGTIALILLEMGISIAVIVLAGGDWDYYWNESPILPFLPLLDISLFLIFLRPYLALDIKRIHDRGRSAYLLVPFYLGLLYLIAKDRFGWEDPGSSLILELLQRDDLTMAMLPDVIHFGLMVVFAVYSIWLLFELGFRRGTDGTSKYGPDPLSK